MSTPMAKPYCDSITSRTSGFSEKPLVLIEPRDKFFGLHLKDIWDYRELLYFLVWRDLKVYYRQTLIGGAWVIIQPLMTMLLFTAVFGKFAKVPSDGLPYPIFIYTALLPWNLFASSLGRGVSSVVGSANLVSKIYFPRLILPLSAALSPVVDFTIAFTILIGMMAWFHVSPTWGVTMLPLFLLFAVITALAVSLLLSAMNVRYRDIGHTIPFLTQFWMFATPVAYPVSMVPAKWRLLYSLNPMTGVIEGFRWALLGKGSLEFGVIIASFAMMLIVAFIGIVYFKHMERTFADVV
jgi:lipopolysaccharide transport system permease protein